jgi:hypothetical protein
MKHNFLCEKDTGRRSDRDDRTMSHEWEGTGRIQFLKNASDILSCRLEFKTGTMNLIDFSHNFFFKLFISSQNYIKFYKLICCHSV